MTFAGGMVSAQANDLLVLELWRHANTPTLPVSYESLWQWNGTVPVTAGTTSDAASYLETPQSLSLVGGGGATISGTIASDFMTFVTEATGSATAGRVGTIASDFMAFTTSMSGTALAPAASTGRTFYRGYAYTISDLEASVIANSDYNTCTLSHATDTDPAHKEPVIDPVPGDSANTRSSRALVHIQGPDGVWRTTALMPPAR
jgi:hypothetical protein